MTTSDTTTHPELEPVRRDDIAPGLWGPTVPAVMHVFDGTAPADGGIVYLAVEPGELAAVEVWRFDDAGAWQTVHPSDARTSMTDRGVVELHLPSSIHPGDRFGARIVTTQHANGQPPHPLAPPPPAPGAAPWPPGPAGPVLSFDSRRGWRHRARVEVWPDRVVIRRRYWAALNRYATVIVPTGEVRAVERTGSMAGRHDVTLHTGAVRVTVSTWAASVADRLVAHLAR